MEEKQPESQIQTSTKVPATPKPAPFDEAKAQEVIFQPNPGPQTDFLSASEMEVLYGGAAGGGKVVYEYQNVLTPDGWKNCKELRVGDTICDPHGGTQIINHLFAWEKLPVWVVEFDDGTVLDTAEEHLWYYWLSRNGPSRSTVKSTKEMWEHSGRTNKTPIIPVTKPVYFKSTTVEIDPYTLGAFLGDGCLVNKSITYTSHEDDWPHFRGIFNFPEKDIRQKGKDIRICGVTRKTLVDYFERVRLLGTKSNSKFVPKEYLFNSKEIRESVLQGLMDTDGHRDLGRARAEFSTVSPRLAEDVKFLAMSLGYRVSVYTKIGSYRNKLNEKINCQKVYRLYITGKNVDDIFRLSRKKIGVAGEQLGRRVVNVEKTSRISRGRCITVSNSDGLYITDDFVVTHNSFAMIADPVRGFTTPGQRALLLRKTTEELRELIGVTKELYPQAIPGSKFLERDKTWVFPSGATLWMSYLDSEDDVTRYQGQAFQWIGFDELTQWPTPYAWNYLRSRLRGDKGAGLYMRATTNPGGVGMQWVKKMFVDPAPWGKAFWATDIETGNTLTWPRGHSREGEPLFKRRFIPAKLWDNPYLAQDGMYEANLLSLSEPERKKLLEGNWDVNEGAAFPEWNREIHTVEPYEIPEHWIKFRGCDYGYSDGSAVVWFAIRPDTGQLVLYRELYGKGILAEDLGDKIIEAEREDKNLYYGVLGSDSWDQRGNRGPTIGEVLSKKCRFRRADRGKGSRVHGKQEFHRRLQVDEYTEEPRMVVFTSCINTISQIPALPLDKNNPEDVDTKSEDHLYDAIRYAIMTRPLNALYSAQRPRQSYRPADKKTGY